MQSSEAIFTDNYKIRMRKSTRDKRKQHTRIRSIAQVTSVQKTGKCSRCDKREECRLIEQGCTDLCHHLKV